MQSSKSTPGDFIGSNPTFGSELGNWFTLSFAGD
jgi:hypothetical protein